MKRFKKEFYAEFERISKNETIVNLAVNISEEAFKNMKTDSEYRAKIMSVFQRDLISSFSSLKASLLITVGATEKDYRGDSWSGFNNDSEFFARSQYSFYKKTSRQKKLLEEYLKKQAQTKKQQQELLNEKIEKVEQERSRFTWAWNSEEQLSRIIIKWKEKECMSISISDYSIHLRDGLKIDREYLKSQGSQNTDQKVFHRDILEISQLSNNREEIIDKIKYTLLQSVTSFNDTRAGLLKEVKEEKGQYGYSDVLNVCGLSYTKLYSEIEQRHENEKYYKVDGTLLTKEEEIEWLDMQYDQEVAWQKSCARIAAQGQVFQGKIPEIPTKEIEELEDSFYQAKDVYMKLYQESRQVGKPLALQNYMFGNSQMYEMLSRLGNLQEGLK